MDTAKTLGAAARGINRELLKVYRGDAKAAEEAISQLMESPEVVEAWATRMLIHSAREAFRESYAKFRVLVEANESRPESERSHEFTRERLERFRQTEEQGIEYMKPFTISELPRSVRAAGLRGLITAYLVSTNRENVA